MSTIIFYSDTSCQNQISGTNSVSGPSDGLCTQFGISNSQFGSFAVRSLGASCVVTVYENDVPYCSSQRLQVIALGQCISNSTINQFSVDGCRDTSAAAPAVSELSSSSRSSSASTTGSASGSTARLSTSLSALTSTATGANGSVSVVTVSATVTATAPASSASPTDSTASEGLSAGAKAGIGVGIALLVIALIAVTAFFVLRHKKKQKTLPVPNGEDEAGLDVAPAYSFRGEKGGMTSGVVMGRHELSPEGRPLAELPQGTHTAGLVEAPGDYSWRTHEMGVGQERSELTGSTPNLHEKHG